MTHCSDLFRPCVASFFSRAILAGLAAVTVITYCHAMSGDTTAAPALSIFYRSRGKEEGRKSTLLEGGKRRRSRTRIVIEEGENDSVCPKFAKGKKRKQTRDRTSSLVNE